MLWSSEPDLAVEHLLVSCKLLVEKLMLLVQFYGEDLSFEIMTMENLLIVTT